MVNPQPNGKGRVVSIKFCVSLLRSRYNSITFALMQDAISYLGAISWWAYILIFLAIVAIRDIIQRKHTISHNFPIVGHIRYMLESIGPEMRQYFIANNREELPLNRTERSWIYASSKKENNYQGFGSDQDFFSAGYHFLKPDLFPY